MYESKTYEAILEDCLARIPDSFDKREGSIIFDALAPACVEIANLYISIDALLNQTFVDSAEEEYLDKRVKERGIERIAATYAVVKAEFTPTDLSIPTGTRFTCGEQVYAVTEMITAGTYKARCEEAGTVGNENIGIMIPVENVNGLETAELTEILTPARNQETDDELRKRYYENLEAVAFGGNIADYKQKTKTIADYPVKECKITPVWNGAGTVKVTITDNEGQEPSDEYVAGVQNALDPSPQGQGYGLAPIGHTVTVEGIQAATINITAEITYASGWDWTSAQPYIKAAIDKYFADLINDWENNDYLVIRISKIESSILNFEGVIDIADTTLNEATTNIQLQENEIPKRGTINGEP